MNRRIIIDGPQGSGKTTLLKGVSRFEGQHHSCCEDFGCKVFDSSWQTILDLMHVEGKKLEQNADEALMHALEMDAANFDFPFMSETHFFEGSFINLKLIADNLGITMPQNYYSLCSEYMYYPSVFVLKPLESLTCKPGNRVLNQQAQEFERICNLYRSFEYSVISVPTYSVDIEENNLKRLIFIFRILKGNLVRIK